jgi:hypothetical protein
LDARFRNGLRGEIAVPVPVYAIVMREKGEDS